MKDEEPLTWKDDPWLLVPEPIYDWFARILWRLRGRKVPSKKEAGRGRL